MGQVAQSNTLGIQKHLLSIIAAVRPMEFADVPPPYSVDPWENQKHARDHHPRLDETFDSIQNRIKNEKHSHNIWCNREGATITSCNSGSTHLKVLASKNTQTSADICMLKGESQVAQARFAGQSGDFEIYVGAKNIPSEHDWKTVKCVRGGLMHSDSYYFNLGSRKLALKKTHDSAIGASMISNENWKLSDESDVGSKASAHGRLNPSWNKIIVSGNVMAICVHQNRRGSDNQSKLDWSGRMDWREEFGDEVEHGALIALISIWEKKWRHA